MPEVDEILVQIRRTAGCRMKTQQETLDEITALVAAANLLLNPE